MLKAAAVAGLIVSMVAVPAIGESTGTEDGGRIELYDTIRISDTRSPPNTRVTSAGLGDGVLNVIVTDPEGNGTATIHPCGSSPGDEVTFRLTPAMGASARRIAVSETACLTSTVPVHVIVDKSGSVGAAPSVTGLQYVPLPLPEELWNAPTTAPEQTIEIARPGSLSDHAEAAVISIETQPMAERGFLIARGCDQQRQFSTSDQSAGERADANVTYVALEPGEDICVYALRPVAFRVQLLGELAPSGPDATAVPPTWSYRSGEFPAASLRAIAPQRVLDSRFGTGRPGTSKVEPNEVVEVSFGDLVTPWTTAVVLNVTVTETESKGFFTAWPCGGERPTASNLNFVAGETVPNLVVSALGADGTICLSGISRAHLIADLNGTFEAEGGLRANPETPVRVIDTRDVLPSGVKVGAGEVLVLDFVGAGVLPATAGAVTANVTVTEPEDRGYVTAFPCDQPLPTASNLNFTAGQTVANLVTAKLSGDGQLCLFALVDTHLIFDGAVWYATDGSAGFVELPPQRLLDTRSAVGIPTTTKIEPGTFVELQVAGRAGVSAGATAAVLNLTIDQPEERGYLTAWPCDEDMPTVSNVNYAAGETNPNLATVKLSQDGKVCLFTLRRAHVVADVAGYFTEQPVETEGLTLVAQ